MTCVVDKVMPKAVIYWRLNGIKDIYTNTYGIPNPNGTYSVTSHRIVEICNRTQTHIEINCVVIDLYSSEKVLMDSTTRIFAVHRK